jgi:hypothetical protein
MCLEDGNVIPLPSEIHLLQSIITFLKQQVFTFTFQLLKIAVFFFSSNKVVMLYLKLHIVVISISMNTNYMKMHII